ncbi:hypothetical protein B4127_1689 [Bacillus pumilus]|uniref:Uncharacterized protein n=1 Tax=Bacillus pumilus TaxID=1408 RepID=A0AB34QRQ8_BACPU|nr:hypothetical protein B4127_1689 [Bacillus pumilus]
MRTFQTAKFSFLLYLGRKNDIQSLLLKHHAKSRYMNELENDSIWWKFFIS